MRYPCHFQECNCSFVSEEERSRHENICLKRMVSCCQGSSCTRPVHEWILSDGAPIAMATCQHHSNGLFGAIRESNIDLAQYFINELKHNFQDLINHESRFGDTILTYAASLGRSEIVLILLKAIESISQKHRHTLTVSDFVDHETNRGKTAIIEAARCDHGDVVSTLLSYEANAKLPSRIHAKSALDWALALGHETIAKMINDHTDLKEQVCNLFKAISKCDVSTVKSLTEGGALFQINQETMFHRELNLRCRQLDLAKQSMKRRLLALNEVDSSKTQVRTEIQERQEHIDGMVKKREEVVSNLRNVVMTATAKVRLAITPDNLTHVCNMANPALALHYELISKALCTLLHVKVKEGRSIVRNDETTETGHWRAIRGLFQDKRFFHRIRHYHFEVQVVELATKVAVETSLGLSGTCLDNLSNMFNNSSNSQDLQQAKGIELGSILMTSVAQWLWTIFQALPGQKIEHELVMTESTERDILERNRIDNNVLTSRGSILKRELDDVTASIKANTEQIFQFQRKLEIRKMMTFVAGGHSVLSWASGMGNEEIVKLLIKRGAHTAIGDDCLAWCATIIQVAFRHSLWRKRLDASRDAKSLRWRHGFAVSLRIKSLSNLSRERLKSLHLPMAEALINGHSHIPHILDGSDIPIFQALNLFPLFCRPIGIVPRSSSKSESGRILSGRELLSYILVTGQSYHHEQDPLNCSFVEAMKCTMDLTDDFLENRRNAIEAKISRRRETLNNNHRKAMASELRSAIYRGDFSTMVEASEEGDISLDYEDSATGMTPLIRAAMEDIPSPMHEWCYNSVGEQVTAVAYLLDRISPHRPNVDYENRLGHTALAMASMNDNFEVIKDLLDRGANANRESLVNGQSPLMYACSAGKLEVVKLLASGKVTQSVYDLAVSEKHLMRDKVPI